jgi:UDP-N-acetylmuramate--alanine ligase
LHPQPGSGYLFDAFRDETRMARVSLQVPGEHNVLNALAALALADLLALSVEEAALALDDFRGTGRRFEVLGEASDVIVIDDYAHHPTEIKATLAAARSRYPGKTLWAVWQPHTYSRLRELQAEFTTAFEHSDHVIVTDVYAAREVEPADFSIQDILEAMQHPDLHFVAQLSDVVDFIVPRLQAGDVVLVLSAGDAVEISSQVFSQLKEKEKNHV